MSVESYFSSKQDKPQLVLRWEQLAAKADKPQSATTQLIYELLVQVRMIKLLLMWVLVIIPASALALIILLATIAAAREPEPLF